MNKEQQEQLATEKLDFRYRLVAELANPYLSSAERQRMIHEKARTEHEVPGLGRRKLSEACIRKWLHLYRRHGKAGLLPKHRRDAGTCRVLTKAESALFLNSLEANPHLTAIAVLRKLQAEGKINSNPSTSSLSRVVRSAGLQRQKRLQIQEQEKKLKFDFFAPLECLQVDCMYAPKIPDAKGKRRHAILMVFLDDATRRVVYAAFSHSENSLGFEAGIKHILAAHGRIGKLYCDNGGSFISMQTQRILDILGVILVHSRPYKPAGRGKIERFFRTSREQFFRPLDLDSIDCLSDLDLLFHTWLESEYHRSPHRGLGGKTPLEAWLEKAHHIIPTDSTQDLDPVFWHEISRKVHRDSTITLGGVLFEVPSTLIGERINLRYDPHIPAEHRRLQIVQHGQSIGEARMVDSYANAYVRRGDLQKEVEITDIEEKNADNRRPVDNSLAASKLDLEDEEQKESAE